MNIISSTRNIEPSTNNLLFGKTQVNNEKLRKAKLFALGNNKIFTDIDNV